MEAVVALSYKFFKDYSIIIVKATEVLTFEDLMGYIQWLAENANNIGEHKTLFDASEITDITVTEDDIKKLFEFEEQTKSFKIFAKKLAIVTRGEKESKIATLYEGLSSRMMENTIVFYHKDLSLKWLGIPEKILI